MDQVCLRETIRGWLCCCRGATAIEYALIAAGVSLALLAFIFVFGQDLNQFFLDMVAELGV